MYVCQKGQDEYTLNCSWETPWGPRGQGQNDDSNLQFFNFFTSCINGNVYNEHVLFLWNTLKSLKCAGKQHKKAYLQHRIASS